MTTCLLGMASTYLGEFNLVIRATASKLVDCFEKSTTLLVLKGIFAQKRSQLRGRRSLIRHVAEGTWYVNDVKT